MSGDYTQADQLSALFEACGDPIEANHTPAFLNILRPSIITALKTLTFQTSRYRCTNYTGCYVAVYNAGG